MTRKLTAIALVTAIAAAAVLFTCDLRVRHLEAQPMGPTPGGGFVPPTKIGAGSGGGGSGDVTGVAAGSGLTGGGSAGDLTINVGAGSGIAVSADAVAVNISGATCGASQAVTAISAIGAGTCSTVGDITSVGATAGGGLTGGAGDGAALLGLITTCGSGQVLKWGGSSWGCADDNAGGGISDGDKGDITVSSSGAVWNIDANTVTGTELAITPTTCSGQFISAIDADGNGTCTSEVGDISAVTAGTGLTDGGTTGAVTLNVGCGTGLSCAADAISVNIVGATCSAGQAMTALGATGTGTCSAIGTVGGSGTTNVVPKWSSSTGLADSGISDNGTTVTISEHLAVGSGKNLTVGTYVYAGQQVYSYGTTGVVLRNGDIACAYSTNGTATCYVNSVGYNEGTTQFRNWGIRDGKGVDVVLFEGTNKHTNFYGSAPSISCGGGGAAVTGNDSVGMIHP